MPTEIPLTSDPSSIFEISLNGRLVQLQTKYNVRGSQAEGLIPYWTLDIREPDTGQNLALGLALVLGVDILRQLNLGLGSLFMFDTTETHTEANENTLGTDQKLIYYTPEEVEALNNG